MGCCESKKKVEADYSNNLTKEEGLNEEIQVIKVKKDIIEDEIVTVVEPKITFFTRVEKVKTTKKILKKKMTMKNVYYEEEEEEEEEDEEVNEDEQQMLGDEIINEENKNCEENLKGNPFPFETNKSILSLIKKTKITIDEEDNEEGEESLNDKENKLNISNMMNQIQEDEKEDEEEEQIEDEDDNEDYNKYLENPPSRRMVIPQPFMIKKDLTKMEMISSSDSNERESGNYKDKAKEKANNSANNYNPKKNGESLINNEGNKNNLGKNNFNPFDNFAISKMDDNLECNDDKKKKYIVPETNNIDNKYKKNKILDNQRKNSQEKECNNDFLSEYFDYKSCPHYEISIKIKETIEEFALDIDDIEKDQFKKFRSNKENGNPKEIMKKIEEKNKIPKTEDDLKEKLNESRGNQSSKNKSLNEKEQVNTKGKKIPIPILNKIDTKMEILEDLERAKDRPKFPDPKEKPRREPEKIYKDDPERDNSMNNLTGLDNKPIENLVYENINERDPSRDGKIIPNPSEPKKDKVKDKERKNQKNEQKDDDNMIINISEGSESENSTVNYLKYKSAKVKFQNIITLEEKGEKSEIVVSSFGEINDIIDPIKENHHKYFRTTPETGSRYNFHNNNGEKKTELKTEKEDMSEITKIPVKKDNKVFEIIEEDEKDGYLSIKYKTTPLKIENKFEHRETHEENQLHTKPFDDPLENIDINDLITLENDSKIKNYRSAPTSNARIKFPNQEKIIDKEKAVHKENSQDLTVFINVPEKNGAIPNPENEKGMDLRQPIRKSSMQIFRASKKILFRKLYPFEIIIEEETVSKQELLHRRMYMMPKGYMIDKKLIDQNHNKDEPIDEEIEKEPKLKPIFPSFKTTKKILFRKLYPFELVIEEETIITSEYIIKKVIMGKKNKNQNEVDKIDLLIENESLLDKRRFTGLKTFLNHKENIISNLDLNNEIDEKTRRLSDDVMINTLPFVFDLILKKLVFVLTKGEIDMKFSCDLNPEVKISFGSLTKIFQFQQKRIGPNKNNFEISPFNLYDTLNKSNNDDKNNIISHSNSKIDDVNLNNSKKDFEKSKFNLLSQQGTKARKMLSPDLTFSPFVLTQASRRLSDPFQPPFFHLNGEDGISPYKDINYLPSFKKSPTFDFDTTKSIFPLSNINLIKEEKENNFINITVSQVEPTGDKFILGEGYISILSILQFISRKFLNIYIPIFYQVENFQIAYIKLNLPTYVPREILDELPTFEEDEEKEKENDNDENKNSIALNKNNIFTKKIVTFYEMRYYIEIQMIFVILTFEERKIRSFIKNKIYLILENKLSWEEIKKFLKSKENHKLIDETKYLIFMSSINEIINVSESIFKKHFFNDNNNQELIEKMLKAICLPFTYKKEIIEIQNRNEDKILNSETKNSNSRKIPRSLKKFDDSLPKDKKSLLTEIILQFYITIIEKYEEIIIFEEFTVEFLLFNFEKKYFLAKERHHKIMLEYLRYFKLKKNLKTSGKSKKLTDPKMKELLENPVNPPEQNPNFIANKNVILKFISILKNYITILTKNVKSKTMNLFSIKKTFEIIKSKIPIYFLHFGSKRNSKGISKYEFLLCYTDTKIIILILEILINYVKLGFLLGYKSKSKLFESEDDSVFKKFFDYLFKNFIKDKKILNLVLSFVYEMFYTIEIKCVYELLKLVNLKSLFTFFIIHNKKVTSKNFKNWIYFFTIISKITKLIKTSEQEHIDFNFFDWDFIFENISILYILSLDNYTKIPKESNISNREDSLEMFTSSNYMNKKFAIQIQMLFFDILRDFTLRTELIKKIFNERKKSFRKIFDQICFICLLTFQDSHLIIAEKEMRRFYFKMLVTLMIILNKFRDECDIDIVEEFKSSLKVIVNSISGKLCKIMTIDKYLNVMIPKLKNLIDMNIFDDSSYFERKVTEMVNRLKAK